MTKRLGANLAREISSNIVRIPIKNFHYNDSPELNQESKVSNIWLFASEMEEETKRAEVISRTQRKKEQQSRETHNPVNHYRYGRWTKEEHEKLMNALDIYGNNWEKVEKCVETRTSNQIRSHLQKHFLKQKKAQITELSKAGLLESRIFVVTREYHNSNITARRKCKSKKDLLSKHTTPKSEFRQEMNENKKEETKPENGCELNFMGEFDNVNLEFEGFRADYEPGEPSFFTLALPSFGYVEDLKDDGELFDLREDESGRFRLIDNNYIL